MASKHAHGAGQQRERADDVPRIVPVIGIDQQQRAEAVAIVDAGGIARRRRGRLHAVVLEDRHPREPSAGEGAQRVPDDERQDARGDRDAERPAHLERRIEVRDAHHHAEHGAHGHGAERQLRHPVALVDVGEPVEVFRLRRCVLRRRRRNRPLPRTSALAIEYTGASRLAAVGHLCLSWTGRSYSSRCEGARGVRGCEGARVRGAKVRRCEGAKVRGPKVRGPEVRRSRGSRRVRGLVARRCDGAKVV